MAKRVEATKTKQPTVRQGDRSETRLDDAERRRIRTVIDTMRWMRVAADRAGVVGLGDYWCEIITNRDAGETARWLAGKLGVPFVLLVNEVAGDDGPTPDELAEWQDWLAAGGKDVLPEYSADAAAKAAAKKKACGPAAAKGR